MSRRHTKQRDIVLQLLDNNYNHPTADWIYEEAKKKIPYISKGTIYRNLQVLQEDGAITTLNLNGAISRYEKKQTDHYHFRCQNCGRVFDLDVPVNREIDERVSRISGFQVSHHQTEFWGLCNDCQ